MHVTEEYAPGCRGTAQRRPLARRVDRRLHRVTRSTWRRMTTCDLTATPRLPDTAIARATVGSPHHSHSSRGVSDRADCWIGPVVVDRHHRVRVKRSCGSTTQRSPNSAEHCVASGGLFVLYLAYRRQAHQEIVARLTEHDASERRVTELYTKAVDQLGSDQAPVRLGGLYALERLAQANPSQQQTIVNVLCAYLRMPYTLPGSKPPDDAPRGCTHPIQRAYAAA